MLRAGMQARRVPGAILTTAAPPSAGLVLNTNPLTPYPTRGGQPLQPSGGGGFPSLPPTSGGGGNWYDPLVRRGIDALGDRLFGSGGGRSSGGTQAEGTGSCPSGFERNPQTGQCEQIGLQGAIRRTLPGGQTGTMADAYGEATMGAFGIPALVPAQVGTRNRADGTVAPILQCPPGAVLGKDNLCYMKGSIPSKFRKWKPSPRPVMSAADAKVIRRAGALKNKVKKLAGDVGFTCRKR